MLKPQDLVILLKLAIEPVQARQQQEVARVVGVSQAEVSLSLRRCSESHLYEPVEKRVRVPHLIELLAHGVKYFYPAVLKGQGRGFKTAWAAPPLSEKLKIEQDSSPPVWAHEKGDTLGQVVIPIYRSVPDAALRDPSTAFLKLEKL